jgi:hypothetical protein
MKGATSGSDFGEMFGFAHATISLCLKRNGRVC